MDYIRVWGIAVGQGQMNFVEIFDDADKSKGLILIDCGGRKSILQGISRDIVEDILDTHGKKINLVLISHTDSDHSNLLKTLGVTMEGLMLGCVNNKYDDTSLGNTVELLVDSNVLKYANVTICDVSSYAGGITNIDLTPFGINTDVLFRIVISNEGTDPNDASTIWQVIVGKYYALFTGDATFTTFIEANKYISSNKAEFSGSNQCVFVTMPHHGSFVTAGGNAALRKVHDALYEFGRDINAEFGVSSSALHKGWFHSSSYVQEAVLPKSYTMTEHACYIHDKKNVYRKELYKNGYLTNESSVNNVNTRLSYSLRVEAIDSYMPVYYLPNNVTAQIDFGPVRSPNPNASKAKRIVSAVKTGKDRG